MNIVKLRQGSGKDRHIGKEWPLRRKALKLEALPRAYIKVGFTQLMVRLWPGEVGGGKGRCVGSPWVTLGSLYVTLGPL